MRGEKENQNSHTQFLKQVEELVIFCFNVLFSVHFHSLKKKKISHPKTHSGDSIAGEAFFFAVFEKI